jgi:hypothetical protein
MTARSHIEFSALNPLSFLCTSDFYEECKNVDFVGRVSTLHLVLR